MKIKVVSFHSGRGSSLKDIHELEVDDVEKFVDERVCELNKLTMKENGWTEEELEGDEEEARGFQVSDNLWTISHGTCDHDMILLEGHEMWDETDPEVLADWDMDQVF